MSYEISNPLFGEAIKNCLSDPYPRTHRSAED